MRTRAFYKNRGAFELYPKYLNQNTSSLSHAIVKMSQEAFPQQASSPTSVFVLLCTKYADERTSRLLTELRRKIWHETVEWKQHILPLAPIPGLEVCRESREFLLEIYSRCFQPNVLDHEVGDHLFQGDLRPFSLYANFETDAFNFDGYPTETAIDDGCWEDYLVPQALKNLKHIAMDASDWEEASPKFEPQAMTIDDSRSALFDFTGFESLSFVVEASDQPFPGLGLSFGYVPGEREDMGLFDLTILDIVRGYRGGRVLVNAHGNYISAYRWSIDTGREFLKSMAETRKGWRPPDVWLARILCPEKLSKLPST